MLYDNKRLVALLKDKINNCFNHMYSTDPLQVCGQYCDGIV